MSDLRRTEVRDFLQEVKNAITNPSLNCQNWRLVRRPENVDCMADLGFSYPDLRDVILGLSVADYCEGPIHDQDNIPGDLWVFGKVISGKEIYIKLKLATFGTLKMVRIVSFHPAKQSLDHPYL